jgi:hypothetical protein
MLFSLLIRPKILVVFNILDHICILLSLLIVGVYFISYLELKNSVIEFIIINQYFMIIFLSFNIGIIPLFGILDLIYWIFKGKK